MHFKMVHLIKKQQQQQQRKTKTKKEKPKLVNLKCNFYAQPIPLFSKELTTKIKWQTGCQLLRIAWSEKPKISIWTLNFLKKTKTKTKNKQTNKNKEKYQPRVFVLLGVRLPLNAGELTALRIVVGKCMVRGSILGILWTRKHYPEVIFKYLKRVQHLKQTKNKNK